MRIAVYNQTLGNVDAWGGPVLDRRQARRVIERSRTSGNGANLSLTITGSGFGPAPEGVGDNFNSPYFVLTD